VSTSVSVSLDTEILRMADRYAFVEPIRIP
jgi:hypothetical protein